MDNLLLLPIITPLFTAVACLLAWQRPLLERTLSVAGGLVTLAAGAAVLALIVAEGIQVVQLGNWPAPFGITIAADLFSGIMVTVAGLIGLTVAIYAVGGIDGSRQRFGFHPLLHVLVLGVCGAFLTGDIFNMYVWFEVMLIASFVLVSLGGERPQLEGAIKYVTLNLLSSSLFLAAAGVLYSTVGTLNMADLAQRLSEMDPGSVVSITTGILLVAFGIKAAVFPLFFWLPASYHTPPAAVSAVMAGLLTKVGVYALVRVFSLMFAYDFAYTQPVLLAVAGTTMITGVLGAAAQGEFRRILSFHIISQIGYMVMGLAIFTPLAIAGTVFYLVHHIIVKTNLFLIAGIVQRIHGTGELEQLGGIYQRRLWLALLFLVPAFSLAGIPPLSGFWAKVTLLRAGFEAGHYLLMATALIVSLLTLFSMTKIWNEAFWREAPMPPDGTSLPEDATGYPAMVACALGLAGLTVGISICAEPLLALASAAAEQLFDPTLYVNAVLGGG